MSLTTPATIRKLQTTLHAKAKGSPTYRFYTMYDKVYREDILSFAYRWCKAQGGAAGVDGQGFAEIATYGEERWVREVADELRSKRYRPQAVRRVKIPKPDGRTRPLGIPTVRDRVVQTAVLLVVSPIFEADLQPEQYAYRPRRSAIDAVKAVYALVRGGHREVVDADLSGYFDSIPHAELMKTVARRISDRQVLRLIKMWLQAPVEERDQRGRVQRTTRQKDEGRGTPQGAPISPLLANLYMRRFVLGWKVLGHAERLEAHIVNYADDFVICCRGTAEAASQEMRRMLSRLKLTVNETKTRVCRLPEDSFDFLGYTIGRCWSEQKGWRYIGTRPAKEKIKRLCRAISEATSRRWVWKAEAEQVQKLNRMLVGWANYFYLGPVSKAYRTVDRHVQRRLRHWLRRKYQSPGTGIKRYPVEYLYKELGLVQLAPRTRSLPWAKA